jgi:4-hydroxy-tetrahydrodipicolinate reductase
MTVKHRLAIIGDGQMGRAIETLARERGWDVVAVIGMDGNEHGTGITRESLKDAEVAVEFTQPDAALANVLACLRAKVPVVVGTTGWHQSLLLAQTVCNETGTPLVWASNFSTGVNLFLEMARRAGELMKGSADFDAHIVETHHRKKLDAPSGTAIALERATKEGLGRSVDISSVRTGSVPGVHQLTFDAPFEQISLTHTARDRRVFAEGALRAAEWLIAKKREGVFTMQDVLGIRAGKGK